MSTGGQVAGGLVGAVVGFLVGGGPTGALYGAQIGIMAGGYLDPPKGPTVNGPRLTDLTVQTSTYGAVIPRVYGTCTVNGNVIWLQGNALTETVTKKKSGGEGGGSKTTTRTYTYSATFAVGLCEGPIVGVRRIWVGPDLIYDAGSSDPDTIAAMAHREIERVAIDDLEGRVTAMLVTPYPPGIPLLIPGERFNPTIMRYLQFARELQHPLPRLRDRHPRCWCAKRWMARRATTSIA